MTINLPKNAQGAFDGNMQSSAKIELPFITPAFWIINGKASMKTLGGVQYFGGWACEQGKVLQATESWRDLVAPPPGLVSMEYVPDDGGASLAVYAARSLYVAVIGVRMFSETTINGEKRRVAPFTPGARPGIQVLSVLGYRDENKYINAWAPIMLSAKGYQVNYLRKAVDVWAKTVKPLAKKLGAEGAHPGLFWSPIGTFGEERKQELVGGAGNKKAITPVSAYIPNDFNENMLSTLYVGEQNAEWMADLSLQARDWLHAFDNLATPAANPAAGEVHEPEEPPFNPDDNIPF